MSSSPLKSVLIRPNEFGHDFFPDDSLLPAEQVPSDGLNNAEYGVALSGVFPGGDFSLYWADIFDDSPHVESVGPEQLRLEHSRVQMIAAAANLTIGNLLIFSEATRFSGLEFFGAPGREFSRTDLLVGLGFSGLSDTTLSIEAANHHIHNFEQLLASSPEEPKENEFHWELRLSRDFLNQRLTLTGLALIAEPDGSGGLLQRYQGQYELADATTLTGGLVFYNAGDSRGLCDIGNNDRLFLELKYNF